MNAPAREPAGDSKATVAGRPDPAAEKVDRTLIVSCRIAVLVDGFPVELRPMLRPSQLPGFVAKLRAIGAEPPGTEQATTPNGEPYCPRHRCGMQAHSKNNQSWFSHIVVDARGEELWCKGRPGKDSKGWDVPAAEGGGR